MKFFSALFLQLVSLGYCYSQQNLSTNYIPLKSSGQLPKVFTQNIRNVIRQDIEQMNDSGKNNNTIKAGFFTSSNYQIQRIIRSGNTLINDDVSNYLNEITDNILKNDPLLRSKISVYAFKSVVVNAYSFDKGFIFVDLGLVAQAETEAQLAFLLCHEIMHYVKGHQINSYVNEELIEKDSEYENKLIEKCQYSKEREGEADIEGFKLFEKSDYNPKQAIKLFDVLQYSNLPFELIEFKKSFFETKNYVIPSSYMQKEVSPISDNSDIDDSKSTHPNTTKRKSVIAEKVKFVDNKGKQDFIIGKERFEYIRDLARMELCRLYLKNRDYPNALYAAYILKQKFPDNQYVNEVICKCLYALTLYKNNQLFYFSNSYLAGGFPPSIRVEGFPQQLYYFISSMPANEFTIMSLNNVYRMYKKFPENKEMKLYSDSLLSMMKRINWGISDFDREPISINESDKDTLNKNTISKTDLISKIQRTNNKEDSVYYRGVFRDLLSTDRYFSENFPLTAPALNSYSDYNISKKKVKQQKIITKGIDKVIFLEPFYYKYDKKNHAQHYKYIESDLMHEKFINNINSYAAMQKFELVSFDPSLMTASESNKMNDYSVLNDWLFEKFDSNLEKTIIFNTNEIGSIISKYNTKYVLKTGIVTEKAGLLNKTYLYIYVIDIELNKIVYGKYEKFRRKDREDLINAKTYQMIYELKKIKVT